MIFSILRILLFQNQVIVGLKNIINNSLIMLKYQKSFLKISLTSKITKSSFGKYVTIYNNCTLSNVKMDDFSYTGNNTELTNVRVGKFTSIGPNCKIGLGKHPTKDFISTHPIFFSLQKQSQITFAKKTHFREFEEVIVGNDVWIGSGCIINDGITIGDGSIIGAGAVIVKDVPPYSIVVGVPGKVIKYRFSEELIKKILCDRWWDKDIEWLKANYLLFHNYNDYFSEMGNSGAC